jgi:hypothetical protein
VDEKWEAYKEVRPYDYTQIGRSPKKQSDRKSIRDKMDQRSNGHFEINGRNQSSPNMDE